MFIKNSITFPRFKVSRYREGWGEDFCSEGKLEAELGA